MCVKVGGEGKGEEFVYSEGKGEGKAFNRERKVKKKKSLLATRGICLKLILVNIKDEHKFFLHTTRNFPEKNEI